jgi:hypothetical protein
MRYILAERFKKDSSVLCEAQYTESVTNNLTEQQNLTMCRWQISGVCFFHGGEKNLMPKTGGSLVQSKCIFCLPKSSTMPIKRPSSIGNLGHHAVSKKTESVKGFPQRERKCKLHDVVDSK